LHALSVWRMQGDRGRRTQYFVDGTRQTSCMLADTYGK
jgi:hypothetical protein